MQKTDLTHRSHRLRSVRMQGGQGDVIMAVNGFQAMVELGADFYDPQLVVYTRSVAKAVVGIMIPEVTTETLESSQHARHPRYAIVPHTSWTTVVRNWFYPDYYVDFPERRLLASYGYPRPGPMRRAQLFLTDLKLAAGTSWRRETPAYYGLKIWAPLAERYGLTETDLMRGLYFAHRTVSDRLHVYTKRLPTNIAETSVPDVAFFPSGGAFQYVPARFIRNLLDLAGVGEKRYACYFAPSDPSLEKYVTAGLRCRVSATTDALLAVVARARVTLTADSFPSHIAQLLAPRHIALMSHDLPQHTVHPAARSAIVYEPQICCPCWYAIRKENKLCPAGFEACGVYTMQGYLEKAATVMKRALSER